MCGRSPNFLRPVGEHGHWHQGGACERYDEDSVHMVFLLLGDPQGEDFGMKSASVGVRPTPESHLSRSGPSPIGRGRMRTRVCSKTATHLLSRELSICGKFAKSSANCRSGRRSVLRRNRTTDGLLSSLKASNMPKSASAETSTRSSRFARSKIF